jgi:aspartyl-tRNA(Asn)/glutamyl-tRNA(Gln) amidotransferase subunit A
LKSERDNAMTDEELCYAGISELGRLFRSRSLSPVELLELLLSRIERVDSELCSFVTVTAETARVQAALAEETFGRGKEASAVHGIPIAYKDVFETEGVRTTAGSAVLADWVPDRDATCVKRLREAGAVTVGKLITHEFAFGIQVEGHRFLPARNPWNLEHIPGGSSSGSAAAISAGLVVAALGTDSGGSIRTPASFCGIVGLKPTYGRVSRAGVIPLSWTLDHVGPMARSVEDCAHMLQVLAGYDVDDSASSERPVEDYLRTLRRGVLGLKVGVPRMYFLEDVAPEVERAFEAAVNVFRRLGASVIDDIEIPHIRVTPVVMVIMMAEAFAYHQRDLQRNAALYGDVVRERLLAGGLLTGTEYIQAQRLRAQLRVDLLRALDGVDVLVTPGNRRPAPLVTVARDPTTPFPHGNTAPFNMSGLPALVVPCGFTKDDLPISLQIVGRPFDEATVLRAGHSYEQATEWARRRPPVLGKGGEEMR